MLQPNAEVFTLSNGLKVVHLQNDRPISHCGIMINAGTRDELDDEKGLAHFIEHAIFKGTKKRRAYHILNRLDSVGGEIDAYTTKENTCLYTTFLSEYYDRSIELISDVILNSTFPANELEKEKEVVIDEINSYLDSPSEQIYDDFESIIFKDHALGTPILGTKESVRTFNKVKIEGFINRLYKAENMVFSSVGNITSKSLKKKLEKHFENLPNGKGYLKRTGFSGVSSTINREKKETFQTHCIMGRQLIGSDNAKKIPFSLLNNILGGPAMNSILNLKVREKYGYTYNIESNYSVYSDNGLFSIYLASDPKYITRCVSAIDKELKNLSKKQLSSSKLSLSQQQLKGQISISRESYVNMMLSNAKSLLVRGRINTIEQIHSKIDGINSMEILELSQEYLNLEDMCFLYFEGKSE